MPKIFLMIFLVAFLRVGFVYPQDCYTVLKIKGEAEVEKTGKAVAVNDELCSNDNLIFKDAKSVVVVHSTKKGRFTLKPYKASKNELVYLVDDIIRNSTSTLMTKSFEFDIPVMPEFSGNRYCVVGTLRLPVDPVSFPMNEKFCFTLNYVCGEKNISVGIPFSCDTLILDKDNLFNKEDCPVNTEDIGSVSLFYTEKNTENRKLINRFKLNFISEDELKTDIDNYLKIVKNDELSAPNLINDLYSYANFLYGKINGEFFTEWVSKNYNLN